MPESKTVLHIEDNPDNRLLIRRLLMASGYQILEAGDASEALALLKNNHPDLILMDMNMPDMDGYTLTNKIKAMPNFFAIPIVAITANVMRGDREKTVQAGCDGYIEKPINVDRFIDQIERFLQ